MCRLSQRALRHLRRWWRLRDDVFAWPTLDSISLISLTNCRNVAGRRGRSSYLTSVHANLRAPRYGSCWVSREVTRQMTEGIARIRDTIKPGERRSWLRREFVWKINFDEAGLWDTSKVGLGPFELAQQRSKCRQLLLSVPGISHNLISLRDCQQHCVQSHHGIQTTDVWVAHRSRRRRLQERNDPADLTAVTISSCAPGPGR